MSHKDFNQIEETLAEVDAEIDAGATPPAEGDDEGRRSQTDIIVEYIRDRAELFHGDNDVAYARDMDSGEVRRIDGRAFRNWLADGFYRHTEKAIRDQALREARMTSTRIWRIAQRCSSKCFKSVAQRAFCRCFQRVREFEPETKLRTPIVHTGLAAHASERREEPGE